MWMPYTEDDPSGLDGLDGLDGLTDLAGPDAEPRSRALAERFEAVAVEEGLADVIYDFADSPFGPLLVALTRRGLVKLGYPDRDVDRELEAISAGVSPRIIRSARATEAVRRQLEEYFEGKRRTFDVPVDLALSSGFARRVLSAAARIPFGAVATYREVATRAGNARA